MPKNTLPPPEKRNSAQMKLATVSNYEKSGKDDDGKTYEMKIVANAGDPGIFENEHYDILSRFLICEKSSANRVPTNHKRFGLYYLVKRPEHLWVSCENADTLANKYVSDRRKDYMGNVNVGKSNNRSINTIPSINAPYEIGEILNCKKLPIPQNPLNSALFVSAFDNKEFQTAYNGPQALSGLPTEPTKYTSEHWTSGAGVPSGTKVADQRFFDQNGALLGHIGGNQRWLQMKPLFPSGDIFVAPITEEEELQHGVNDKYHPPQDPDYTFHFILHYYLVHHALGIMNPDNMTTVTNLKNHKQTFQGHGVSPVTKAANPALIDFQGGFLCMNMLLGGCGFEDMNNGDQGEKQRTITDSCMPLIVTSPNQFPTPKTRAAGAVVYQPTYAVVAGSP